MRTTTALLLGLEVESEMRGVSAGLDQLIVPDVVEVVMSSSEPTSTTMSSFPVTGSYTGGG